MKYSLPNGRLISIPDAEIEKCMVKLELTKVEAIQLWLEDNEYEINEEQEQLDKFANAKENKIKIQARKPPTTEKKETKSRPTKKTQEEIDLFNLIKDFLAKQNIAFSIVTDNKRVSFDYGAEKFEIAIIKKNTKLAERKKNKVK